MGLSGGQQQRLCIARTIAVRPEVILLDEPTSALDPISTLKIEELIDELKHDFTIAIVTHNMQQAARCRRPGGVLLSRRDGRGGAARRRCSPRRSENAHPGIHHRPVRLSRKAHTWPTARNTSSRASTRNSKRLRDLMTEMGGIVEKPGRARRATRSCDRDAAAADPRGGGGPEGRCAGTRGRAVRHPHCSRCASRWPATCARSSRR